MKQLCDQKPDLYQEIVSKTFNKYIPFIIDWEITYRCNLKCSHCYQTGPRKEPELSTEKIFSILDELAESIDTDGIEGLDRSLKELGKDRTVFIITHRQNLLDRLFKHKKITIVKEGGFSKILESE